MKRFGILSTLIFALASIGFAQVKDSTTVKLALAQQLPSYIEKPADATAIYAIYPGKGIPPGFENKTWHEQTSQVADGTMVRNVVIPTVTIFKPATANGTAIIVAPGGGFHVLMMDNEGYEVAHWLTKIGITVFVLKYRVQHTPETEAELTPFFSKLGTQLPKVSQTEIYPPMSHPGAEEGRLWGEEDARQAIRFIRQNAKAFGVDANRIGIMGFSAGAGIAVNSALRHDDLGKPNFIGGLYTGYRIVSPLPQDLPPLFLAIADDDKYVAPISSARLYEDWHKTGQSVELHIFKNGSHGFGMKHQNLSTDAWKELFKYWLMSQGLISADK